MYDKYEKAQAISETICNMELEAGKQFIKETYNTTEDLEGVIKVEILGVRVDFFRAFPDSKTLYFEM